MSNEIKNPAAQFMLWVAGVALALAYVIEPVIRLVCSITAPNIEIPHIDLSNMWVPVFTVTGVSGLHIASQVLTSREARKDKELEIKRCAECPTANCAVCPLKNKSSE